MSEITGDGSGTALPPIGPGERTAPGIGKECGFSPEDIDQAPPVHVKDADDDE